jgi:hypothetical protein
MEETPGLKNETWATHSKSWQFVEQNVPLIVGI